MSTREPLILEYRGAADPTDGGDAEYGFLRELFGWFLISFLVVGSVVAMGWGVLVLERAIQ